MTVASSLPFLDRGMRVKIGGSQVFSAGEVGEIVGFLHERRSESVTWVIVEFGPNIRRQFKPSEVTPL